MLLLTGQRSAHVHDQCLVVHATRWLYLYGAISFVYHLYALLLLLFRVRK